MSVIDMSIVFTEIATVHHLNRHLPVFGHARCWTQVVHEDLDRDGGSLEYVSMNGMHAVIRRTRWTKFTTETSFSIVDDGGLEGLRDTRSAPPAYSLDTADRFDSPDVITLLAILPGLLAAHLSNQINGHTSTIPHEGWNWTREAHGHTLPPVIVTREAEAETTLRLAA